MISKTDIESFNTAGVVCLPGVFESKWIALARKGIERNIASPGPFFRDHTSTGSPGRYVFDFWNWRDIPEFQELMFDSPLGELGAQFLGARRVRMLMDNWFMRESGSASGAPWHHDEPYFDFEGRMCIVWMPLEAVSAGQGLTFVRGSHNWGQLYVAEQFSENVPFDAAGDDYEPMPDFDNDTGEYDFLSWDLEPGDCLVFDFRTIHSAGRRQRSAQQTTHRMTFRLGGEGVVFQPRGQWTREISDHLTGLGQTPGATLDNPLTPVIFDEHRPSRR